jgi:aminoglycoside phosphotransferase family enzyme/predicted kinase
VPERSKRETPVSNRIPLELGNAESYPGDPSASAGVTSLQTHISWVFLTRNRVYKLRKPVRFGFLNFGTRELRDADCLQELQLNRRLAPDVYLGVAPVLDVNGRLQVGPEQDALCAAARTDVLEHCVVMRRLPTGYDALSLLENDRFGAVELRRVAETIAGFHRSFSLGIPAPFTSEDWLERITRPVHDSLRLLAENPGAVLRRRKVELLATAVADRERSLRAEFERRRSAGRAVDGHGDLHLQHIWLEPHQPVPILIDCVEFNDRLRRIDQASDAGFLAMDLAYRGRSDLAEQFLATDARASGDYHLYCVIDYFLSYRAAVRAKVAALAAADPEIEPSQRARAASSAERHLDLALSTLADAERQRRAGPRQLVVMCGLIGSGKSTAAEHLAERLSGVIVSSDWLRRQLASLDIIGGDRDDSDRNLYSDAMRARVYDAMREAAQPVLESGRVVILDATHGSREVRWSVTGWASRLGVTPVLVETRASPAVTAQRLRARAAAGQDASEAGPELYDRAVASFERPDEWMAEHRFAISTDTERWHQEVASLADHLKARQPPA